MIATKYLRAFHALELLQAELKDFSDPIWSLPQRQQKAESILRTNDALTQALADALSLNAGD